MTRYAPSIAGLFSVALILSPARPASADPPPPLSTSLFAFPGYTVSPGSAISAGRALADRWLGEEPFGNPAAAAPAGVAISGTMLHVSRQDLRAGNRNFDDTPAFFDGAGVAAFLPSRGPFSASLYAFQPVLRREANAFTRGTSAIDPGSPPPATLETTASARELRAGGGLSAGFGPARIGGSVEWIRRRDAYQVIETSGSPIAGTTRLELEGTGVAFQLGARLDLGDSSVGGTRIGVALRRLPALTVDAPLSQPAPLGIPDTTLVGRRAPGWELGTSARLHASPSFDVLAAVGGHSAQRWEGLDQVVGRGWEWKVAAEYHDARDPWTLRIGLGQERQSDAFERRADIIGLGFGQSFAWGRVDLGLTHRTLDHAQGPTSFEDRVIVTVATPR